MFPYALNLLASLLFVAGTPSSTGLLETIEELTLGYQSVPQSRPLLKPMLNLAKTWLKRTATFPAAQLTNLHEQFGHDVLRVNLC